MKVKVISLPYIFQVLFVLCFTRPRYQVSVYETIGPLVIFLQFMIMKSDINKLVCILLMHLSFIILENFKDRALIISEKLELIELHTYKFGLVYEPIQ